MCIGTTYMHSVLIRNGPIRNTSEIFGFFKKRLVKSSKLRNPTGQLFQSKKRQRFFYVHECMNLKNFIKIDYILKIYSAKTKHNFLMKPFVIQMLIKGKEIHFFGKKIRNDYQNWEN